jgi:hypothetical protein
MENKIEQSDNKNLSIIEKYGLWIMIIVMIGGLIAIKILIDYF